MQNTCTIWLLQICVIASYTMPMLWPDVVTYWPEIANDLTRVSWSHATNNQGLLDTALADGTMMIEADVSVGEGGIPIMAHPPANTSDLTLKKFLCDILTATADEETRKGIKLDFKDINIVKSSLMMVKSMRITIPLWLNADVLRGPGDNSTPVDPDLFITLCQSHLPMATLSLGWTTSSSPGKYSPEKFQDLDDLLDKYHLMQSITLPLRASLAADSRQIIVEYLSKKSRISLTIWSIAEDRVNVDNLVRLISEVGKDKVYLDVPQDLEGKIVNNVATLRSTAAGTALLALILAIMWTVVSN